ncbi:hypothetical protein A2837_01445 [Candidatus Kaiserbacteria bacterium RIFCSPHIGHO2_01_FULL_46_22]|uniref:Uncharacterized protein n=1 Tax=Candidatus Kaiserbacteria bacterium RIFCSPHIGHO2_01_FULL_46_22 TaxID=1798475 RepID=A0A1F6BY20_9BACT|nr:MAG: hypothetical protein A2837_01445 [Candidatus Kaiserbacteria bacterium RIFCSPHIGHO2_01_FULL_46_22]
MDLDTILSILNGWFFLLAAFGLGLGLAMAKGRQTLINLIVGAYLGLFLYTNFPYLETLTGNAAGQTAASAISLVVFLGFTIASALLFSHLMPREYLEGAFEAIGKKLLLAGLFTVLVLTLSTHFLPIDAVISTGTPLPEFLLEEKLSFLWLVLPLAALFFL